jgi:hypothetical protein
MRYDEFVEELFIAVGNAAEIVGKDRFLDAKSAATRKELKFQDSWILEAVRDLELEGWLTTNLTLSSAQVRLTGRGWDHYEDLLDEYGLREETTEPPVAPASDRLVALDHNSAAYIEADSRLSEAIKALRENNEYKASDPEDYEQRIAELEGGQRLLKAPRIRLGAVIEVLIRALQWLAVKLADTVAGKMIEKALTALATLLGFSL